MFGTLGSQSPASSTPTLTAGSSERLEKTVSVTQMDDTESNHRQTYRAATTRPAVPPPMTT